MAKKINNYYKYILVVLTILLVCTFVTLGIFYYKNNYSNPSSKEKSLILDYTIAGGIAGYNDEIKIWSDNRYEHKRSSNNINTGYLLPFEISAINGLRSKYGQIKYETPSTKESSYDSLYSKVIFQGNGVQDNEKGLIEIEKFANQLLLRIRLIK